ncbi:hypothetical protein SDC9_186365 [bioreactor metagenome]|uniref:Uncharacterized protein n=1 Tax=bioreactor metagenome TaxID=1076179 RepID=A0A645HJC2_9ZZZZ
MPVSLSVGITRFLTVFIKMNIPVKNLIGTKEQDYEYGDNG